MSARVEANARLTGTVGVCGAASAGIATGVPIHRPLIYRAVGPPRLATSLLGPVTVVLTLVVFGTRVELWLFGYRLGFAWASVHHASSYLWFAAMLVHVINYLTQPPRLAPADWRDHQREAPSRQTLVAGSLILGIVLATLLLPFPTPFALPAGGG